MYYGNDKNCDTYGLYESPGESPTAALCNGGWYDGKKWETCPAKDDCRIQTLGSYGANRVSLPQITSRRGGSRTIATTPNLTRGMSRAVAKPTQQQSMTSEHLVDHANPYLATERAPHHMGPSPTFIPTKKEGVFKRLTKNVTQGWLASFGWHIFDMAQQVDMFPEDEDPPTPKL